MSEALKYAHIARRSHINIEISRNKVEVPEGVSRMFNWSSKSMTFTLLGFCEIKQLTIFDSQRKKIRLEFSY